MQRRFDRIRWTRGRVAHIVRHGVAPEEAYEALLDEHNHMRRTRAGRYLLYGRTGAGRPLVLVLVDEGRRIAGLVTARDASGAERRAFFGGS